eukprot:CAMPEP_0195033542 /NCGR_PEP_ID=MMETSP0326_2-20130528/65810_1 /TAXON_ID=2866 ORGANISM="Crypthecodinium cohnii, Strain Seligo" /NCGR_SAMPLE_ID=MMETSP0326_2 /ASSEMBLY_ACC=CAM_ASM_000348 /LENGTH=59 /DNA_ID=CAMNT_0040058005 /DNA_START=97 /DNA_END=273 /DNA_ORIENTATION=+
MARASINTRVHKPPHGQQELAECDTFQAPKHWVDRKIYLQWEVFSGIGRTSMSASSALM